MKNTFLILLVASLTSCANNKQNLGCPVCHSKTHFDEKNYDVVNITNKTFKFINNNREFTETYAAPVIVKSSKSWICGNGHTVYVTK